MIATRITPGVVKLMLACEVLLLAGLIILAKLDLISRHSQLEVLVGLAFGSLARVITIKLFWNVANEYRDARLSRLVWLAFATNSVLVLLRNVISNDIIATLTDNYHQTPLQGFLNHILSVPAAIFLLLGLVGMLQSYRRAGLGTKLRGRDYVLVAISLALFGWLVIFHENLEEGQSPWLINRILQPVGLTLIASSSIVSIVLHRYTAVMQGGKMARVLSWLVLYGLLPGALVLLIQVVVPVVERTIPFDATPLIRLWALLPWAVTFAAVTRAGMTADVVAQVAKLNQPTGAREAVVSGLRAGG
jgi:hypothetical protein